MTYKDIKIMLSKIFVSFVFCFFLSLDYFKNATRIYEEKFAEEHYSIFSSS